MYSSELKRVMLQEACRLRRAGTAPDDELWEGLSARSAQLAKQCAPTTVLRFLQGLSSAQFCRVDDVQKLLGALAPHHPALKPPHYVFLLQALSRLRVRTHKLHEVLRRMSLLWTALPLKLLVRAANAVAKLDLADS